MTKLRTAIIGIGHLGSKHLKVTADLKKLADIVAICDTKSDRTKRLASHYQVPVVKDYKDLAGQIDAVQICVPTSMHYEIAKYFLKNNVHTFIEKPMTLNTEEADELIALADQNSLKLQVGHVERFNSAFVAVNKLCKNPRFIECHRLNHFPNRSLDIGVVMDLMIHDIDIVLGLNQCAVKDYHAVGIPVLTPMEDIANARIIFENGCVCNLTASRISDEVTRKIRIFQKDTYISLDYVKQEAWVYKKHGPMISKHALPIEKEEPLKKEIESFLHCIRDNTRPIVSGEEGRAALKLSLDICEKLFHHDAKTQTLMT